MLCLKTEETATTAEVNKDQCTAGIETEDLTSARHMTSGGRAICRGNSDTQNLSNGEEDMQRCNDEWVSARQMVVTDATPETEGGG